MNQSNDERRDDYESQRLTNAQMAEQSARTSQTEELTKAGYQAVTAVQQAVQAAAEVWRECREGAIEGRGVSVAEQVCIKLTNALGAEDARRLGEGASNVVSGNRDEGIRQCVESGVRLAIEIASHSGAVEAGRLTEEILRSLVQNELKDWFRTQEKTNQRQ